MKSQIATLGAAALALGMFGGGYLFGYVSGRGNALEESWSKSCKTLGEFYLCDDLRGFNYEAVDLQYAAMEFARTEVEEQLQKLKEKKSYSFTHGVLLAVRRDTKKPFLVAYYKPTDESVVVAGSISLAVASERVKALREASCPDDPGECKWEMIYYVSVYQEVTQWADTIVTKVSEEPEKKE